MRRNAREAVARRAQELSPNRKLSHSLSVPPTSTTPTPPITVTARKQKRSSSTSRITPQGSLDLPPCERAVQNAQEPAPHSPPKGYHKYTERLQAYIRSQSLKQPLEQISSGAVTKEDRKQRCVLWILSSIQCWSIRCSHTTLGMASFTCTCPFALCSQSGTPDKVGANITIRD